MKLFTVIKNRHFPVSKTLTLSILNRTKTFDSNTRPLNITENSIIISQSHNIFENLALEDWLYSNYDMASKNVSILLLWYNSPSIIIGRHQNPWVECSVKFCEENGINVVRRNSGGGTVFHDFGNLNLSFLTSTKAYNRKRNLELICDSVLKRWTVDLKVTARDDILYKDIYKVSGTASKLGRNSAYHHCTVLVNVDQDLLHQALNRDNLVGVKSKATSSVRSKVINLSSICREIDTIGVIKAVSENFKQFYEIEESNVLCLHPNEQLCPGFNSIIEKLQSWSWRFGKTPLFTVTRSFPLSSRSEPSNLEIEMKVDKGVIQSISLNPPLLEKDDFVFLCACLQGNPFSIDVSAYLDKWVKSTQDKVLSCCLKNCILEMIQDVCS